VGGARHHGGRPAPLRAALERLTDAVPLTEDIPPGPVGDERRRRLDRLARPHTRSVALTVVVPAAAAGCWCHPP